MKRKNEKVVNHSFLEKPLYEPIDKHTKKLLYRDEMWLVMVEGPNTLNQVRYSVLNSLHREFPISYEEK